MVSVLPQHCGMVLIAVIQGVRPPSLPIGIACDILLHYYKLHESRSIIQASSVRRRPHYYPVICNNRYYELQESKGTREIHAQMFIQLDIAMAFRFICTHRSVTHYSCYFNLIRPSGYQ